VTHWLAIGIALGALRELAALGCGGEPPLEEPSELHNNACGQREQMSLKLLYADF
jgi:hypothetical protein